MKLSLTIKQGPGAGTTKLLRDQMTLGRKNADFLVSDPSASGHHATVVFRSGAFYLIDNHSKNGTYVSNKKVNELPLRKGVRFRIGKTLFEIEEIEAEAAVELPEPEWFEVLEEFTRKAVGSIKNKTKTVEPISPGLKLSFIKGLQEKTVWHIGYGPRKVGRDQYHFNILDPEAPENCFTILSSENGPVIKDDSKGVVKLNNATFKQDVLKTGDEIEFLNTSIIVELVNAADKENNG